MRSGRPRDPATKPRALSACLVPLLLLAHAAAARGLRGRAVGVGDVLTVPAGAREQVRAKSAEIDAPGRRQPCGARARQAPSALAFGQAVRVAVRDTDRHRHRRGVGRVFAAGQDVSAEMVRRGAARVCRRHGDDPDLLRPEERARAARRGLWASPEAERVPPWAWRAAGRGRQFPAASLVVGRPVRRLRRSSGVGAAARALPA